MTRFTLLGGLLGAVALTPAAHAQLGFTKEAWALEASVSANATSGNAESTDLGLGFKAKRVGDLWRHAGSLTYDYGDSDGEETKNRLYADYQADRSLGERTYGYGRGSYELDEFDGYDYRVNLGTGLGYDVVVRENTTWSLQGGPGVQIDAIEDIVDPITGTVVTPGDTQTNLALGLGSRFSTSLNENVSFTNNTDLTWTEDTTIIFNTAALTAQLTGALSARLGFDVTHDTEPPAGSKSTDTTTRASLVYAFGEF
ncbi:MAG: DUF481 domain-containing protein [Caulobacterales bacterium]|nr:DUF481 domain-containing protein [Caulobacterales bacterium]